MIRKGLAVVLALGFFVSLNGCATSARQKDLEIQRLRNQVSALQAQLDQREESRVAQSMVQPEVVSRQMRPTKKVIGEAKSRPSLAQIQIALKNAGYYSGSIDGKMGAQTRNAIKTFQRDNNLLADGRVGKKTWSLLRGYLYKRVK
ncbi:MAG: peptidoglycan-binding domain-containing protein [Candidatus Omnitrophica bacterium]|nr:peptidoglycan-binding domain-containing protein [Candidatus Omnitrophota bacterium]